jgi:hypothetical protein
MSSVTAETAGPIAFELPAPEDQALEAIGGAAEAWGAEWTRKGRGGRLQLPVNAGLRQGWIDGQVEAREQAGSTRLAFRLERAEYRVHWASVAVLSFGGAGALLTIIAPLFPALLWELVPFGVVLMLVAWLLVASKVRHKGVEELFALAEEMLEIERDRNTAETAKTAGGADSRAG